MKLKKGIILLLAALLSMSVLVSCGAKPAAPAAPDQEISEEVPSQDKFQEIQTQEPEAEEEATEPAERPLEGHTLHIFCGAGMKKPFEEIALAFEAQSGCTMEISYANAAQIQTQINTAQEGDFFIAGSPVEVKPVEAFAESSSPLVKHIPVIAVQKGNPLSIAGPADLGKEGVRVVIGDPEATPIGKIANKIFADFEIQDRVMIVSNTTTAPAMSQVLAADECDAVIIWKENVDLEAAEIIESAEMDAYIKNIPAVHLTCSADAEASEQFLAYLQTEEAQNIWLSHGYELA